MTNNTYKNQTIVEEISLNEKNKIRVKKDKLIITKDKEEKSSDIYILISGEALLEIKGQTTNNFMYLITKNQLFGMENLIIDDFNAIKDIEYTVTALTDCCFVKINAQLFLDHIYVNPYAYHTFFSDLVNRYFLLAESHQHLNQAPEVKLGIALLNISVTLKIKKNNNGEIVFPKYITQRFLSQYVRSSEPNLSKASIYLEKAKLLKRKPFVIRDEIKLKEMIKKKIK